MEDIINAKPIKKTVIFAEPDMDIRENNKHIKPEGLLFQGVINDVKKSKTSFQPIFEAFTNAIEAIKDKTKEESGYEGEIIIEIYATETTIQDVLEFHHLTITDNGIGFNDKEFMRFNTFKDFTKGYNNLGSGRIQFVHYFDNTNFKSVFLQEGNYYEREFIVSKNDSFLNQNSIVFHKHFKESTVTNTGTKVSFYTLLENSPSYNELTANSFKSRLLERYLHYFCCNRSALPKIKIRYYIQSVLKEETNISQTELPTIDKSDSFELQYSKISIDGKSVERLNKTESFNIDSFKVDKDTHRANILTIISKGEIVEEPQVLLKNISENQNFNGSKYLFFISSEYFNSRDTNMRGILSIPNRDTFQKNTNLFSQEEIFLEDIEEGVNSKVSTMYPEIEEVKNKHTEQFDKLKKMFLLDNETASTISISINDSESKILEKFYEAEAKKSATIDANIKESIDRLENLDTTLPDYNENLQKEVEELVKTIPLQNKTTLTRYVARRKLVLELFDKINNRLLSIQNDDEKNKDEKLLHNLIFQQSNSTSQDSDLWLVNEDFLYFKGASEGMIKDITLNDDKLLKDSFTTEEETFITSLGENRIAKRPDILLFPDEGKCIIIEFKNPNINVSDHLNQISNYAALIWNLGNPKFKFDTFYGYLIGEKINPTDVRFHDGAFIDAYQFDYMFRPNKIVPGLLGDKHGRDASLYTEVIKYTTLLKKATRRNEIFIAKLLTKQ